MRHVNSMRFTERGKSLVLRDIVRVIADFANYGGDPLSIPLRLPIPPVEVTREDNELGEIRMAVRFVVDWERADVAANDWGPWLQTRWFTPTELGTRH